LAKCAQRTHESMRAPRAKCARRAQRPQCCQQRGSVAAHGMRLRACRCAFMVRAKAYICVYIQRGVVEHAKSAQRTARQLAREGSAVWRLRARGVRSGQRVQRQEEEVGEKAA